MRDSGPIVTGEGLRTIGYCDEDGRTRGEATLADFFLLELFLFFGAILVLILTRFNFRCVGFLSECALIKKRKIKMSHLALSTVTADSPKSLGGGACFWPLLRGLAPTNMDLTCAISPLRSVRCGNLP